MAYNIIFLAYPKPRIWLVSHSLAMEKHVPNKRQPVCLRRNPMAAKWRKMLRSHLAVHIHCFSCAWRDRIGIIQNAFFFFWIVAVLDEVHIHVLDVSASDSRRLKLILACRSGKRLPQEREEKEGERGDLHLQPCNHFFQNSTQMYKSLVSIRWGKSSSSLFWHFP